MVGCPVLLTENSELNKSESSISLRLLVGLSLRFGPKKPHSVSVLAWPDMGQGQKT